MEPFRGTLIANFITFSMHRQLSIRSNSFVLDLKHHLIVNASGQVKTTTFHSVNVCFLIRMIKSKNGKVISHIVLFLTGQFIDGPENGIPVHPWGIPLTSVEQFRDFETRSMEVPHTASVRVSSYLSCIGLRKTSVCSDWLMVNMCLYFKGQLHLFVLD